MKRSLMLAYGVTTYAIFFATFLYLIGFVGGMIVPRSVDAGGATTPIGGAILVNVLLIALFAIQHTIMARPTFKRWWTKIVPVAAERSTFVLITSGILILTFWQWRPMPTIVWSVDSSLLTNVLLATFFAGWGIVLLATFLIDHFDLFGLRQTVLYALGKQYTAPRYVERSLYRVMRHPLMFGMLVAFWSAPTMTQGRLLFAGVFTLYILIALRIEERTLVYLHGDDYRDYQSRVSMLLPLPGLRGRTEESKGTQGTPTQAG